MRKHRSTSVFCQLKPPRSHARFMAGWRGREGPCGSGSPAPRRLGRPAPLTPPLPRARHPTRSGCFFPHRSVAIFPLEGQPAPWGQAQSPVPQSLPATGSRGLGKAQQQNEQQIIPLLHSKQASVNHQVWEFETQWTRRFTPLKGFLRPFFALHYSI